MGFGSKNGAGDEIEAQQLRRQQAIQQGSTAIEKSFEGFGPEYYEGVRKSTLGTLVPQLNRQYRGNVRAASFGLGNRGLLRSSAAREQGTELAIAKGVADTAVNNQANAAVRETQQQVAAQKTGLTNQLIASQDPTLAAQQAVTSAASIGAPSIVAPLGNLFQGFANAYLAKGVGEMSNPERPGPTFSGAPQAKNRYTK